MRGNPEHPFPPKMHGPTSAIRKLPTLALWNPLSLPSPWGREVGPGAPLSSNFGEAKGFPSMSVSTHPCLDLGNGEGQHDTSQSQGYSFSFLIHEEPLPSLGRDFPCHLSSWGGRKNRFTSPQGNLPWGPGKPLEGQPKGCPSVPMRVYSCSIPNQGCWLLTMSIIRLQVCLKLVSRKKESTYLLRYVDKYTDSQYWWVLKVFRVYAG